ncbi:MAG TPA: DNA mismatch repair protein MutL, partial [Pseudoalteromonas shioyasakiensis]|nr:DNA mismatch repair protein MutL [Pseudoalteromonas shioyasakiensis]
STQYTYVNNRMMRDKLILHAIRQAFEEVAGSEELPGFVIYIDIDPRQVDVNVHPAKHEVRFHQGRLVHDFILQAIKQVVVPLQHEAGFTEHNDTAFQHAPFDETHSSSTQPSFTQSAPTEQYDYPKSELQPTRLASYSGATGAGRSSGGFSSDSQGRSETSHQDVNAFYQGISEQHAAHFDQVRPEPSVTTPVVEQAKLAKLIHVREGECVFSEDNQLFAAHFKHALALDWQAHVEQAGSLDGKALLLPVRVNASADDISALNAQQSWFTLLGFDLVIEKQFVMVKKLPPCVYLLDVSDAIERLIAGCKASPSSLDEWLAWLAQQIPARYYASQAFLEQVARLENNPQTMQRLRQKAVKIELSQFLN